MSFQKILDKYRKIAFLERDKGDRFERLMQTYLLTDPKYAFLFKHVWLWNQLPGKLDLGCGDTGINLVALTRVINVSVQTVEIVEGLPKLKFE